MTGSAPPYSPLSSTARVTEAVPSGRSVIERPPLSRKVYISLLTTSVVSPTPRSKSSVCSKVGTRISVNPNRSQTLKIVFSTCCQRAISSGRMSFVPLGAFVISSIVAS